MDTINNALQRYKDDLIIDIDGKDVRYFNGIFEEVKDLLIRYNGEGNCEIPSSILTNMNRLESIDIHKVSFIEYDTFSSLSNLKILAIAYSNLKEIPITFKSLIRLENITIRKSSILSLELPWVFLNKLIHINLESNFIKKVPKSFYWHKSLESVSFAGNPIQSIEFSGDNQLGRLKYLSFGDTKLKNYPLPFDNFLNLERLHFYSIGLSKIPLQLLKCVKLKELNLAGNNIEISELDINIRNRSVSYLDVSNCNIYEFPQWLKSFEFISELVVSYNPISKLPKWLNRLPNLSIIYAKNTLLTHEQIREFEENFINEKLTIIQ